MKFVMILIFTLFVLVQLFLMRLYHIYEYLFFIYACEVLGWFEAYSITCSYKGILWLQRLHQRTETRVCIFPGPD